MSVFQIMTLENWNDILLSGLRSQVIRAFSLIYLISWILVGNYVLLNLFLAVLLDGFDSPDIQDEIEVLEEGIEIAPDFNIEKNQ